jgi:hypothetical protein
MDVFKLEEVELEGNENDVIEFSKALRGSIQHPNEIHMTNITMTDSSLSWTRSCVVGAVVTVTDLKVLTLENVPIFTSAISARSILHQPQDCCFAEQQPLTM